MVFLNESSKFSFQSFTSSSVRVENQRHVFVLRENVSRNGTPAIGTCSVNTVVLNISRCLEGSIPKDQNYLLFHAVVENCCNFLLASTSPPSLKGLVTLYGESGIRFCDINLSDQKVKCIYFPTRKPFSRRVSVHGPLHHAFAARGWGYS